jgi:hypothetical protein
VLEEELAQQREVLTVDPVLPAAVDLVHYGFGSQ